MYTKKNKAFMASLNISVISKYNKKEEKFYTGDFIKNNVTMSEAVDQFSKFCLTEYFYLIKKNSNKQIYYVIICNKEIFDMFNNNTWIDQLRAEMELTQSRIIFKPEGKE